MQHQKQQWNPFNNNLFPEDSESEEELIRKSRVPKEKVPEEANDFYHDFGLLLHPKTGEQVKDLADYQLNIWNDKSKYRLIVKSQKVGISTSVLLEDFQRAITVCKGKDILLIAQTQDQANEHILTLKTLIINSEKYRKYLITDSADMLFKEEKTKLSEIFIKNPDNPKKRTRIIGKGPTEAGIWSWKNVAHIHMSDIAANNLKDDSPIFAAAFSRLASTDGTMIIETPPRGPYKKTFEIYQQSLSEDTIGIPAKFKVFHVSAQDAVKANVMSQKFLDDERIRLGPTLYAQNYECTFTSVSGNLFSQAAIDKTIIEYDLTSFNPYSEKYITVDPGYTSSKFAILVTEFLPREKKIRILEAEEIPMPTYEEMLNRILVYRKRFGNVLNIGVDATSRMEFCLSLKQRIGESSRIPFIKDRMELAKKKGLDLARMMIVVPIIFSTESKNEMASHTRRVIEDPRRFLQIHPKFLNLITAMRSAVFDDNGQLDKNLTPHNDILDAFFMACRFFHFQK